MDADLGDRPWYDDWPEGVPRMLNIPELGLADLLRNTARRLPDFKAVVFLDTVLTYRELDDYADRFATSLSRLGLKKGDVAAIMLPNSHQFVIAYYACLRLGIIVTAVNPIHKPMEVKHQLIDSVAKVLIVLDAIYESSGKILKDTDVRHVIGTNIVDLCGFGFIKRFMGKCLGKIPSGRMPDDALNFIDFLDVEINIPSVEINAKEDLAVLQYTGGTTGTPKGAMLTHYNLVANTEQGKSWVGRSGDGVGWVGVLPLFHIYAMTCVMNAAISSGGFMLLFPRPPADMIEWAVQVEKWGRGTDMAMPGVTVLFNMINKTTGIERYDLSPLKRCLSGAGPLTREVQMTFEEKTGAMIVEGYGLSETSPVATANPFELRPGKERVFGSIGLPFPNTDLKIVDIETGERRMGFGTDETGEICIKGPQVMKGYYNRPEETARALRDGWFYTGDIAYMNERGWTFIMDRAKDMIKYKGYSVFPREIEDYLLNNPHVQDVAVIGVPSKETGENVIAFVVLKPESRDSVSEEEIIAWCEENMAHYKVPKSIEFRNDLPKTIIGKILRRVLREEELNKIKS
jgi:long-chain acyl-CoA synthetase